ncbi:MAG: hypothetical protein Q7T74_00465 [Candidatus Saccharibacteria bacterium]|nr:hypothetical protein [Candidatus Saccharibacteria bacterium]
MQDTNKQKLPLSLWLYIPLWVLFVYLYIQILFFTPSNMQNFILGILYFIEFGVHEASHLVFAFLPSILTAAAGSIGEVTFTVLIVIAALKGRAYFATIFGCIWVMLAMNSAGMYMADARSQLIPLVGFSNQPQHDWYYVFGKLGWLNSDVFIGGALRGLGDIIGLIALGFGLWLIIQKILFTSEEPNKISSI